MVFENLTVNAQTILLSQHEYLMKWLLFIVFISLSSYYVFVVWKEHKPTIYITTVMFRLFLYGLSLAYLLATPLTILTLSPEYSFYDFYLLPLKIYGVMIALASIVVFFDIGKMGLLGLAKLGGLDVDDSGVDEFVKNWKNNKHFLKFKKGRGIK